ncbi:DUF2185 domain-containing protein [Arsenicibacter rosenii]|uniref:Immunity protein Imm33 domain-containing protein n=1 Tax=Arsenicibacter rosenii TaxID=1750698 RepID=A0A1S2VJR8_9BACT|nr:DUF2185 domain-containing protein [Arsenicibacter rosenii]OIN58446.1 hypothetical protein BLX24_15775 [Arsenicibacter rosenii]
MNTKEYKLKKEDIKSLTDFAGGCLSSDKIVVEGLVIGYMYREEPEIAEDNGWRFFSGTESDDYINDAQNLAYYSVNTIANYDPSIIPYLESPIGSEFMRIEGTNQFEKLE